MNCIIKVQGLINKCKDLVTVDHISFNIEKND